MKERFEYLEGMRGFAAVQVVLLHYCSVFLPAFAHVEGPAHYSAELSLRTSPLFFLINGNGAVYLFFLISGFVLAPSFIHSDLNFFRQVCKRFVRLFLPIMCALAISATIVCAIPPARDYVFRETHSAWVMQLFLNPLTIGSVAHDALASSMLIGYQMGSIFQTIAAPLSDSLDPPLWSLHAEFWGSVFILAVAMGYRTIQRRSFGMLFAILFALTLSSYFCLFLAGFALYLWRDKLAGRSALAGAALIVAGVIMSSSITSSAYGEFISQSFTVSGITYALWKVHATVTTLLLFAGVIISPAMQSVLSTPFFSRLGRISFSLYLLHFPILFTVGFLVFGELRPHFSYATSAFGTLVIAGGLTIVASIFFERFVDRPSVRIARMAGLSAFRFSGSGGIRRSGR